MPSLVEIGSVVLKKKIFKFCQCIFAISKLSPLGKRWGSSIEQIWIPFIQGCFGVCLKLAQWFWRRIFLNFLNVFSLFRNYTPLENGVALHLNKLGSPSPKDDLCKVWLKLAQWFWRRRFLNFVNVFSLFRNYLPLEKGGALHLNKFESLHPRILCAKFRWNWLSGSGEDF